MNTNKFAEGLNGEGFKFGIVRARFNEAVTQRMLDACLDILKQAGVKESDIELIEVPGVFEIPLVCQALAKKEHDAVITLGCVMRGQTPHDRYISSASIDKLFGLSLR